MMAGKGPGKGPGKGFGAPAVNFNVQGVAGTSIEVQPAGLVAVYRGSGDNAMDFCEKLRQAVKEYKWGECKMDNLDVSQVQWNTLSFSVLLDILQEGGIATKRIKAFKANLDDDAIKCLASYLESLPPTSLPDEVHLSNNQITQEGLSALLGTIELKRSQVEQQASLKPIWVRLENNKVDDAILKSLLAEGRAVLVKRVGERPIGHTAAIAMPSFEGYEQYAAAKAAGKGAALAALPAAWAAASKGAAGCGWKGAGKDQWSSGKGDSWGKGDSSGKGDSWGKGDSSGKGGSWGKSSSTGGSWSTGAQEAPGGSWSKEGSSWSSGNGNGGWKDDAWKSGGSWNSGNWWEDQNKAKTDSWSGGNSWAQVQANAGNHGKGQGDTDAASVRSRTPPPVFAQRAVHVPVPARKGFAKGGGAAPGALLPDPWEEHFSDEYKIPYFWNRDTGDAVWERPTA